MDYVAEIWWLVLGIVFCVAIVLYVYRRSAKKRYEEKGNSLPTFSGKPLCVFSAVAVAITSVTLLCTFPTPSQVATAEEEAPSGIVAAQVRKQGFTCENPISAKRDAEQSKPHETVWLLQCKTERYRVRLVPKMAAKVERLEDREEIESR